MITKIHLFNEFAIKERVYFLLLQNLKNEYLFHCECRKLSPKTIKNYEMLLRLFFNYLEREQGIVALEDLCPIHIKQFINYNIQREHKPAYINDLLKVCKCFFKYLHEEVVNPQ